MSRFRADLKYFLIGVAIAAPFSPMIISATKSLASPQAVHVKGTNITKNAIIQEYLTVATEYWGHNPAYVTSKNGCADYVVVVGALSKGAGRDAVAEAGVPGCWMRFSPGLWHDVATAAQGKYSLYSLREGCVFAVHEFGHSLGRAHVSNDNNVMNAYPRSTSVPECNATFSTTASPSPTNIKAQLSHNTLYSSERPTTHSPGHPSAVSHQRTKSHARP